MLVLDANILIRAVLGVRVLDLLRMYAGRVDFFAPDTAFAEAREWLPDILRKRGVPVAEPLELLTRLGDIVECVDVEIYAPFGTVARERIGVRDEEDWPVLATAMALRCPIWTEDTDFFGCGVATWTTDRVEMYLLQAAQRGADGGGLD